MEASVGQVSMRIKLYMGFKTQRISGLLVRKQIPNDAKDFSGGAILPC